MIFPFNAHVCTAQFADSFSDGDFTSNPTWSPDIPTNWTTLNNQLRSNSSVASSSFYITTPSAKALTAQWEFTVNLQFNTSSTNYVDVFITSDLADLNNVANNGYFVRIGGTPDEISLYKLSAGVASILINGVDGTTNTSSNTLRIKVVRDAGNVWKLERDLTGTGNQYVLEGTVTDNTFSTCNFFGIRVQQSTATFFNKHFFDDLYAGEIIMDTEPPAINSVVPTSATTLTVVFNEKIELLSAEAIINYSINNGVGQSITIVLQPDQKTVLLTFGQSFPNGSTSELTITGVSDLLGNAISSAVQNFFFFQPVPAEHKDIIITEIFADPSPVVGLPGMEFIEIHNRSNKVFDLQNWKITDGSSVGVLPTHILFPNEYMIVTASSVVTQFSTYGIVIGASNFPTLNNSGDELTLKDNADVTIDRVKYADSWYRDDDKSQGGYTLELIDPANPCGEEDNWVASEAVTGGTPGIQNSVYANKPDLTGPVLLSAIPTTDTTLVLKFNEKLLAALPPIADFVIAPSSPVSQVLFTDGTLKSIQLKTINKFQTGTTYSIQPQNIFDCNGNPLQTDFDAATFGLPESADSLDCMINEILFNPRPTGVDFVEVYNNTSKFMNLKKWSIANYENGIVTNAKILLTEDFLLSPKQYIVFTKNKDILIGEYSAAVEENIVVVIDLPGFNDDAGSVALVDSSGNVVDAFSYSDGFHSVFIDDDEGVSLERIAFSAPTNEQANWNSASSTMGFATPGMVNSNKTQEQAKGKITVTPEVFEPITGQPNFTQIQYNFDQGGFVANVKILDFQGREIKKLASNATLATEGFFRWDGDCEDGSKARTGYYIVWFEVYNAQGELDTYRKRVVIATRM